MNKMAESPTSMKMKNTFLLLNNNPSFDQYAAQMRRRKQQQMTTTGASMNSLGNLHNTSGNKLVESQFSSVNIGKKNPAARDGHISVLVEGKMFIFGGDRHHMPFNDLFMLDLEDFFFKEEGTAAKVKEADKEHIKVLQQQ